MVGEMPVLEQQGQALQWFTIRACSKLTTATNRCQNTQQAELCGVPVEKCPCCYKQDFTVINQSQSTTVVLHVHVYQVNIATDTKNRMLTSLPIQQLFCSYASRSSEFAGRPQEILG